jgi:uncharacterized integral membrane protein
MHKLKSIIMAVLVFAAVLFAVQNSAMVEIQFLVWSFSAPRALLVLVLLGVGFVVGLISAGLFSIKRGP